MTDLVGSASGGAPSAAQALNEFGRWWRRHLYECIPAAIRARIARGKRPALWSPVDDRVWPAAAELDAGKPFAHSALAQRGGDVALVVGEAGGFRRTIELPLAVEPRLGQVLGFEIDRLTPLKPTDLHYDFRVIERNAASRSCRVEVVAVPRARVATFIEEAQRRNLQVKRLLLAPSDVDTSLDLFASSRDDDAPGDRHGWINPALMLLCVLLALALVIFPLWQLREQVIALQPIEAKARADAEVASVLQRQLEKQVSEYNLPLQRKHASPLVVQVLDDLSKRLPDDTWVQTLEIRPVANQKTREVIIQGETGSGGSLLQTIQQSPLIKDPTFKATMTRVTPTAERFHIAGELVAAELPKQIQLSDAAAVTTVQVAPAAPAGAPTAAKPALATTPPPGAPVGASTPGNPAAPSAAGAPTTSTPAEPRRPVAAPSAAPSTEKKP